MMNTYNGFHPYQGRMIMGAGGANSVKVKKFTLMLCYSAVNDYFIYIQMDFIVEN